MLGAVDAVFAARRTLSRPDHDPAQTVHQAVCADARRAWSKSGTLIEPDEKDASIEGWDAPFDTDERDQPARQARRARSPRTVEAHWWRRRGTRPRDVLILVRQRGPLFEAIIRALKREGIAVAGADRLVLTEHIAVMDLHGARPTRCCCRTTISRWRPCSRARCSASTTSSCSRSPTDREGVAARGAARQGRRRPGIRQADDALDELAGERAALHAVRLLCATCSAPSAGRKRFLARLGLEADDALDEFLNLALDYERRETPSLQGFVAWLRAAQSEVKRDMEIARDEVRVMTVHGAKGLEAPIVILADTTTPPEGAASAAAARRCRSPARARHADALIWAAARTTTSGRWRRRAPRRSTRRATNTAGCSMSR